MTIDMYDQDLARRPANFASLTPLSFLERAACVHPDRVAVIHGSIQRTWSEVYKRCRRLASALARRGVQRGHTVAAMTANTPEMYEAHFGVPMCGAVLNAINTRLDAKAVAFILDHAQARVLLTDREFSGVVKDALAQCSRELLVVDIDDPNFDGGQRLGTLDYEALLAEGDPDYPWQPPVDEWDAISLNYTSGTTGNPKGVVYHHRGAHLNSLSNIVSNEMPLGSVYLWTLPMFHCNGWCYPWTLAALAGTS
ncbi:MAG: AMP-binding protein, partial [Myxococcales bacterium]|nr:AMP-binding protein [Myxococcales bacterium]